MDDGGGQGGGLAPKQAVQRPRGRGGPGRLCLLDAEGLLGPFEFLECRKPASCWRLLAATAQAWPPDPRARSSRHEWGVGGMRMTEQATCLGLGLGAVPFLAVRLLQEGF